MALQVQVRPSEATIPRFGHTSIVPRSQYHHVIVAIENFLLPTPSFNLPSPHTYELREYKKTTPDQVAERIRDAEILIAHTIRLGPHELSESVSPNLRMISIVASGTDSVDLETCRRRGIIVANAPRCNTSAVAEHAIGLYFSVRRSMTYTHQLTQAGEWPKRGMMITSVMDSPYGGPPRTCRNEVVGIVGCGAIGNQIADLARALGMRVLISARKGQQPPKGRTPFEEVIRTSSVIFLSLPKTPDTTDLISTPEFKQMLRDSILINVSRGGIVNEEALVQALEDRDIAGAATDVFAQEPASVDATPLIGSRVQNLNLITTPHSAWRAEETYNNFLKVMDDNVSSWVGGKPINVVI